MLPFPESCKSGELKLLLIRLKNSQTTPLGDDPAHLVHVHATDTAQSFHIFDILAYHLEGWHQDPLLRPNYKEMLTLIHNSARLIAPLRCS
jgi:hypothetical protein